VTWSISKSYLAEFPPCQLSEPALHASPECLFAVLHSERHCDVSKSDQCAETNLDLSRKLTVAEDVIGFAYLQEVLLCCV